MKAEYAIRKVIINTKKREITICDNGMDIPEQVIKFEDEDEWFSIKDRKGNYVLDGNIWWDEQWGFQYVGFMEQEDKTTGKTYSTNDGDYRNPNMVEFVGGDNSPFYTQEQLNSFKEIIGDKYEWRAVLKQVEGEDNIESMPLGYVNVNDRHEVEAIGLYQNNLDGTQTHIIDIPHSEIRQWNGVFMGLPYGKVK